MPSAFLQWLYADAADVPQTGYEVSRNSDPMSPKFTRPRNSASGSEECGLILPLGAWVLRRACAEAAGWPGALRVAVNLSPAQFAGGELVTMVAEALDTAGLAPERLELEITETAMVQETETVLATLRGLQELGVGIAMDDFGTGYSSLGYLRRFPFDRLKIDRSFIEDLGQREASDAIVRAILALCNSLGIAVTAEGVETWQQADALERALEGQ